MKLSMMECSIKGSYFLLYLTAMILTVASISSSNCLAFQGDEVVPLRPVYSGVAVAVAQEDKKSADATNQPGVVTASNDDDQIEVSKQFAQLHLRDGSVIGGEIKTETIDVKTDYGVLTVPIARISKIYPGLNSSPELKAKMVKLVEDLGADDAPTCDAAQRDLLSMGPKIKNVIREFSDAGVAERAKRLREIQNALDEMASEMEDEALDPESPLASSDRVVTPDFSIVGEIQQKEFQVQSKFGKLQVQLGDILMADRMLSQGRPDVRKAVKVGAMSFFQTKPVSAGIRVSKGDRISIRADGVVQWTNWNSSSTPEGLTNRSSWQGINSGTLVARIGTDNSKCVKVGSNASFVAKSSGTLYLGISMRDSYATNSGYSWTGDYNAKVRISPK